MNDTYLFVGLACVVLIPLMASVVSIVVSIIRLRRDPPLPEILARDYATKLELKAIEARISADLAEIRHQDAAMIADFRRENRETDVEIFNLIRDLTSSVNKSMSDLEKGVARIEGKLANCPGATVCAEGKNHHGH